MSRRSEGLFAGRGISWRTIAVTIVVVALAFSAGVAAGWATSLVPDLYRSANSPPPSPSPTPTPTPTVDVSVPPLEPIDREITDADLAAGVSSVNFTLHGDGAFTAVPGEDPVPTDDVPVRRVRIDVEDGLGVNGPAFGAYVMSVLNDPRGWGSEGRMQFIQTEGVPDLRVVLASPFTVIALCPDPHATGEGASAAAAPAKKTSASPDPSASPAVTSCADRGTVPISEYDWIAGLPGYGDDVVGAREYLLTHGTGHVLGEAEGKCVRGTALVMANQREPMKDCNANPWAFPDAPVPAPSASATPAS